MLWIGEYKQLFPYDGREQGISSGEMCGPSVVNGEKPHVWLFNWGLNSSRADFLTFQFNVVLGCLDVNLVGSGCVLSSTMVVAKGCAAAVVVLITNPRAHLHRLSSTPSSPTLHTHYINVRAPAIELPWSLVVRCVTTTTTATTTAIANVAIMIQQPWFVYID